MYSSLRTLGTNLWYRDRRRGWSEDLVALLAHQVVARFAPNMIMRRILAFVKLINWLLKTAQVVSSLGIITSLTNDAFCGKTILIPASEFF